MRVLIACERSGVVRRAFRALGHDAFSCDLVPSDDDSRWHIKGDALEIAEMGWQLKGEYWLYPWDLMIAHPPCTDTAVSGSRWFPEKRADGRQQAAIDFFMKLANAPIPKIALEQPISIISSAYRKPDQIIHPHQFGHPEFKATSLWLKNLPRLRPTDMLTPPVEILTNGKHGTGYTACRQALTGLKIAVRHFQALQKLWQSNGLCRMNTKTN